MNKIILSLIAVASFTTLANDKTLALNPEQYHNAHAAHSSHEGHLLHKDAYLNAPVGIMGSHTHNKGEWMFAYRLMHMQMDGLRDGSDRVSHSDASGPLMAGRYPTVPEDMKMEMHMFSLMYGATNDLTLMFMLPYLKSSMNLENRAMMGTGAVRDFKTRTDGLGDIKAGFLYNLYDADNRQIIAGLSLSMPTGSTDQRANTPMAQSMTLPYPMQLGSGTWDLLPTLTYKGHSEKWAWGSQLAGIIRTGKNDEDYRKGHEIKANVWLNRKINQDFSTSLRLQGLKAFNYHGVDDQIDPMRRMAPTADASLRSAQRIDIFAGFNYSLPTILAKTTTISFEFGMPVYQSIDGPNLETDWTANLGWFIHF